jgi:FG-GAP repeat
MSRSRVVVLVLAATLMAAAFPAVAQPRVDARPDAPEDAEQLAVFADFNGDNLRDLAIGAPTENFGSTVDAGAVSIFYGVAAGSGLPTVSQTLVQGNPEAGDHFGAALEAGFFNNDNFYDLVVGVPGENLDATADAGAVNVFFGSAGGLPATSQVLVQDNPEAGDRFGAALATGFIDGNFYDLVVGAPGENVGATVDAGAANFFSSGTTGVLPPVSGPALLQDNPEAGDQFGAALTSGFFNGGFLDLVVGAPGENVGATVDAGAANFFSALATGGLPPVSGPALLQNNPEAGDQFGAALATGVSSGAFDDLVVGAPGETVGAAVDAGAANIFPTDFTGVLPSVSGPALLQDNPEAGDRFGAALTAKFLDGGFLFDVVVGAPGENVGATVDAGAANVFTNPSGMVPAVSNQTLLQGNPEAGDQFGAALDV